MSNEHNSQSQNVQNATPSPILRWVALALLALLLPTSSVFAASFTCSENVNGSYCVYTGPVKMVYVNDSDLVLLYWDDSITQYQVQSQTNLVGLSQGMSNWQGGGASLYEEPEFANLLYATLLTAYVGELEVTVQMRSHIGGYLEVDRIWMSQ